MKNPDAYLNIESQTVFEVEFEGPEVTAEAQIQLTAGDFKRLTFGQLGLTYEGAPVKLKRIEARSTTTSGFGLFDVKFTYPRGIHGKEGVHLTE